MINPGSSLPKGVSLFPRLDPEAIFAEPGDKDKKVEQSQQQVSDIEPEITIDDFAAVDLRAAEVISAEKVPKTDKLLKLELNLGFEKRFVVAGIAQIYKPEELIGKTVVVLANLKPAKLKGVKSQGMILAGVEGEEGSVAVLDRNVKPGTRLK